MTTTREPYRPAMGSDRLTPLYDLVARLVMNERAIKGRVVALAALPPEGHLLDLGCGTGTLAILAKQAHPHATVVGMDGDPRILGMARRKAERAGVAVQFDEGMAYALPYPDASFDAATATLMLHHLTPDQRAQTLVEARRVLRPGGRLVLADIASPHNGRMGLATHVRELFARGHYHGRRHGGHAPGGLDEELAVHGWQDVSPPEHVMTLAGTLTIVSALRPAGSDADAAGAVRRA